MQADDLEKKSKVTELFPSFCYQDHTTLLLSGVDLMEFQANMRTTGKALIIIKPFIYS